MTKIYDMVKIKDFHRMNAAEQALQTIFTRVSGWHGQALGFNADAKRMLVKKEPIPIWVMRQYDELLDILGKHSDDDKGPFRDSLEYRITCTQCGGDGYAWEDRPDPPGSTMPCYRCGTTGHEWVDKATIERMMQPAQPYGGVDCPDDEPDYDLPEGKTARADEDKEPF